MNRRAFLRGALGTAAGFIVPQITVPERRFWQLDQTMIQSTSPEARWISTGVRAGVAYEIRIKEWDEWSEPPDSWSLSRFVVYRVDDASAAVFVPENAR